MGFEGELEGDALEHKVASLEKLTGKDLDGDGDVGEASIGESPWRLYAQARGAWVAGGGW